MTEEDEANAKYEGGPKSMSLFGFVERSEIQARKSRFFILKKNIFNEFNL